MSLVQDRPPGLPAPETQAARGWFARFLDMVEWLGNLLPHPVTLFALFALAFVIVPAYDGLEMNAKGTHLLLRGLKKPLA